jgi:hypothetical protein
MSTYIASEVADRNKIGITSQEIKHYSTRREGNKQRDREFLERQEGDRDKEPADVVSGTLGEICDGSLAAALPCAKCRTFDTPGLYIQYATRQIAWHLVGSLHYVPPGQIYECSQIWSAPRVMAAPVVGPVCCSGR